MIFMGKNKKLRNKINAFVSQLTPDEVREQLILAYMQMERCLSALRGEDVEPVDMKDNGVSSDLELFYSCKKCAEELSALNEIAGDGEHIGISVDIDPKTLEEFKNYLSEVVGQLIEEEPTDEDFKVQMKYVPEKKVVEFSFSEGLSGFAIDVDLLKKFIAKEVDKKPVEPQYGYFFHNGKIHKGLITDIIEQGDGTHIVRVKGYTACFPGCKMFVCPEDAIKHIVVADHKSYRSDEPCGYFIDSTNRVFRGAKWYLEDQNIEYFENTEALRKYLLSDIIKDGEGKK